MPALSDPQLEVFARGLAADRGQSAAARESGVTASLASNWGMRKARLPEVIARVQELRNNNTVLQERHETDAPYNGYVTLAVLIPEVFKTHRLARKTKQLAVSIQALRLLADLGGHTQRGVTGPKPASANPPLQLTQNNFLLQSGQFRAAINELSPVERKALLAGSPELIDLVAVKDPEPAAEPDPFDDIL